MKPIPTNHRTRSPWPHRWAWLLACATFPLIWIGGLVTTIDAGMAFPDWLTSDGYFMPFYPWLSSIGDKFVEHGHRLLGMTCGLLSIALVVVTWRVEPRRWVRRLSLVILAGVVLQGLLGGMRVLLDERTLALVHGCTGPLFFALCVAMVVCTSRWWQEVESADEKKTTNQVYRLAVLCASLAYLQLVIGAMVRHSPHMTGSMAATIFQVSVYFHVVLAMVFVGYVLLLAWRCLRTRLQRGGGLALLALVAIQWLLGMSSWLVKYGVPRWTTSLVGEMNFVNREADALQTAIVTSHVAIGSLIFVLAVAIALRLVRQLGAGAPQMAESPRLESPKLPTLLMEVAL